MRSYRIAQRSYILTRGRSAIIDDFILGKPNWKRKNKTKNFATLRSQISRYGFARLPFRHSVDELNSDLLACNFLSRITSKKATLSNIVSNPSLFVGRLDADTEQLYSSCSFASLVTSQETDQILNEILGENYVLTSMLVWISLPCKNRQQQIDSAQVFHIDYDFVDDIKIFVNLNKVTAESGPLEYVSRSHLSINKRIWSLSWHDDSLVKKWYAQPYTIFTGDPGSSYISNNRGIHRDSPPTTLDKYYKIGLQICASRSTFGAQAVYKQRAIELNPGWPSYQIWLKAIKQDYGRFRLLFK
jgi:hypothetical protein